MNKHTAFSATLSITASGQIYKELLFGTKKHAQILLREHQNRSSRKTGLREIDSVQEQISTHIFKSARGRDLLKIRDFTQMFPVLNVGYSVMWRISIDQSRAHDNIWWIINVIIYCMRVLLSQRESYCTNCHLPSTLHKGPQYRAAIINRILLIWKLRGKETSRRITVNANNLYAS